MLVSSQVSFIRGHHGGEALKGPQPHANHCRTDCRNGCLSDGLHTMMRFTLQAFERPSCSHMGSYQQMTCQESTSYSSVCCLQGLANLLWRLGDKLCTLAIQGRTGLLQGFKFSFLWTMPNLRVLDRGGSVQQTIDHEDFGKGVGCLK